MQQTPAMTGYTTLYSLRRTSANGEQPKAALITDDGLLYGTTYNGGTYNDGTVFSMSTSGPVNVLYSGCYSRTRHIGQQRSRLGCQRYCMRAKKVREGSSAA